MHTCIVFCIGYTHFTCKSHILVVLSEGSVSIKTTYIYSHDVRCRADIQLFVNSALNRVLEPSIMMSMTLSNGQIHLFEVSCYLPKQRTVKLYSLLFTEDLCKTV